MTNDDAEGTPELQKNGLHNRRNLCLADVDKKTKTFFAKSPKTSVRLDSLGRFCALVGVVYLYVVHPLLTFEQNVMLTILQVATDIPSVICTISDGIPTALVRCLSGLM